MADRPSKSPELKSRGVYELPLLTTANEIILVAVNRRGQWIADRRVPLGANPDRDWFDLETLLDRVDPPLALVRAS